MTDASPQHELALQRSRVVRKAVGAERRRLRSMHYTDAADRAADILDSPGDVLGAMRVGLLLTSIEQIGPDRMRSLLAGAGVVSPETKLRALTSAQRAAVAWALLSWCDRRSSDVRARDRRVARQAA